jgi:hypothetical protein
MQGISIQGTDNILDGIHSHHNGLAGIEVWSPYEAYPYGVYGSRNIIRNSISHDNSGAGFGVLANGAYSNGIAIASGADNRVENCLAYGNSSNGINVFKATNTYIGYSIAHSNGIADGGGNGLKAGGLYPNANTTIEHSLSYSNRLTGVTIRESRNAKFRNNTTWNNLEGYVLNPDTVATGNIATEARIKYGAGIETDNSWQRPGKVSFISTDPNSPYFLVPTSNGGFEDIGAYANTTIGNLSLLPDLVVTDVSYANSIFTATVKNQGLAATPAGVAIGVGYSVDGQNKSWGDVVGPLAAGQSVEIGTKGGFYAIPQGTYTIAAHVDDAKLITEMDETNNQLSRSIVIGTDSTLRPDLIVTQVSYANGAFTATVKNQGSAATPAGVAIGVGYFVDGRVKTWGDTTNSLAPGQSVEIGTRGGNYLIPSGTHTIMAYVDDVNRMTEINETNNQFSRSITLP